MTSGENFNQRDAASPADLAEAISRRVPGAIARAITWCEVGGERAARLSELLPPTSALVIGVTGSPGSGKSTLVGQLVAAYRVGGRRVAVAAVDPSSPVTGGALLGDRVRLEGLAGDRNVFFRSLASRGAAGGLSEATRSAVRVLSAGGFDPVIVETVGAGQSEVEVMHLADVVLVVLTPGAGDEMQALKSGIMEIGHIYVLNKADQPGIADLRVHVAVALRLRASTGWRPAIVETVAMRGRGVDQVIDAIERQTGAAGPRDRTGDERHELLRTARRLIDDTMLAEVDQVLADVRSGALAAADAAGELVRRASDRARGRRRP